jgi:hypothetical protein
MTDHSNFIVDKLVQYFYAGDYTSILEKEGGNLDISTLQLHARVFALADKYYCRLKESFNAAEFLKSSPDVYHLTPLKLSTLRTIATCYARNHLEKALHDSSYTEIYDNITSQVPSFTKDLLDSYIASPILADCVNCGFAKPMQVLQARCRKCSRGKGFPV